LLRAALARVPAAALDPATGEWHLGRSDGATFDCQPAGIWLRDADLRHAQTGRFGADRRHSIVAVDTKSNHLLVASLDGRQLITRELPGHSSLELGMYVGDFSGAGSDQIAGIDEHNTIWVGEFHDDVIGFSSWGFWPGAEHLIDRRVVSFWR
jgi:hypothetical protein